MRPMKRLDDDRELSEISVDEYFTETHVLVAVANYIARAPDGEGDGEGYVMYETGDRVPRSAVSVQELQLAGNMLSLVSDSGRTVAGKPVGNVVMTGTPEEMKISTAVGKGPLV